MRKSTLLVACMIAVAQAWAQGKDIFPTFTSEDIPYRIPAIATAKNGNVVAVADYRYSRQDIGTGRIDLHLRVSKDKGRTWGEIMRPDVMRGNGLMQPGNERAGYGDPCIVGDKQSNRMIILSCSGMPSTFDGTREQHLGTARWYSMDGGLTWGSPEYIGEEIYSQFDHSQYGPLQAMFVASGRILQSSTIRKGDNYRLYCAIFTKGPQGCNNFVLFSDNFGQTWNVLGGAGQCPIIGKADEAKVEELPNGNILISSRCQGGRNFNIFTFSDTTKGEGKWGEAAFSGAENGGVESKQNACNGDLMLLSVTRTSDKKKTHLLLQSVPFGPQRSHVGIYYKDLSNESTYSTPEAIAANWDGKYEASQLGGAYSAMTCQKDNSIGFLYEECTHCGCEGGGYTLVYQNLSIKQITGGKYK